jgi:hypothetical protein
MYPFFSKCSFTCFSNSLKQEVSWKGPIVYRLVDPKIKKTLIAKNFLFVDPLVQIHFWQKLYLPWKLDNPYYNHMIIRKGAVHKLCHPKGGGGWGFKNCQFYLVKRRLRGGEGVKNRWFWDGIVYGRPQRVKVTVVHELIFNEWPPFVAGKV